MQFALKWLRLSVALHLNHSPDLDGLGWIGFEHNACQESQRIQHRHSFAQLLTFSRFAWTYDGSTPTASEGLLTCSERRLTASGWALTASKRRLTAAELPLTVG